MPEAAQTGAASGPSTRVRLAELAGATALATPGVVSLDSGPTGLHSTVGGGTRVAGVTCAAAPHGGYDLSLRLVCELVALHPLADRVRHGIGSAASVAGLAADRVSIEIVDVVDPRGGGVILLLKALSRLVEVLLMLAIALIGIGIGLYCLSGLISLGSARPDRLLHLPSLRHHVGHFLAQIAAPGSTAVLALLAGIVAVIVGLMLVVGELGSRRERLLVIEEDREQGGLYARRRPLSQMAREETERASGVTGVKRPQVKLTRSGRGGRVKVRATRGPDPDGATVDRAVHERLDPIGEQLHLRTDVRVRLNEPDAVKGVGS